MIKVRLSLKKRHCRQVELTRTLLAWPNAETRWMAWWGWWAGARSRPSPRWAAATSGRRCSNFFAGKKNRSFFSSFQKFLPSRLKNNFSFSINSCFTRTLQFFSGSDIVGLRSSSAGNLFCFDREPDGPMCVFYISVLQKWLFRGNSGNKTSSKVIQAQNYPNISQM